MQLEVMSQGPCIKSDWDPFLQMLISFIPSLIPDNINMYQTYTHSQMVVLLECIFSNPIQSFWMFRTGWVYTCTLRIVFIFMIISSWSFQVLGPAGLLWVLEQSVLSSCFSKFALPVGWFWVWMEGGGWNSIWASSFNCFYGNICNCHYPVMFLGAEGNSSTWLS
jgi:hypothetical protein